MIESLQQIVPKLNWVSGWSRIEYGLDCIFVDLWPDCKKFRSQAQSEELMFNELMFNQVVTTLFDRVEWIKL